MNIVLSGETWPDLPPKQGAMVILHSHDGRFATATANTIGTSLLANHQDIEWLEPRAVFSTLNDVAQHWMGLDQVTDSTNISAINSNYAALDGSGIIVTVADTGIDNGLNNSNMHDDFSNPWDRSEAFANSLKTEHDEAHHNGDQPSKLQSAGKTHQSAHR